MLLWYDKASPKDAFPYIKDDYKHLAYLLGHPAVYSGIVGHYGDNVVDLSASYWHSYHEEYVFAGEKESVAMS